MGHTLTYTLDVRNDGPSTATGVGVTDNLPSGTSYQSATASQGSCSEAGGTVSCSLGTLASGGSASVEIEVTANADGTITNSASVDGDQADPDGADNSDSEDTTVRPLSDLSITKSDDPDPVFVGHTLTYTLDVRNDGPSTATGVGVTDNLPSGTSYQSATASQGSCSEAGGTVSCSLGTLASGGSASVEIEVTANADGTITNSASVDGDQADPDGANNSDSERHDGRGAGVREPGAARRGQQRRHAAHGHRDREDGERASVPERDGSLHRPGLRQYDRLLLDEHQRPVHLHLHGAGPARSRHDRRVRRHQRRRDPQPGEPEAVPATKAWVAPATAPGHVTGGGQVLNPAANDKIAFGFNAKTQNGTPKGECNVVDPSTDTQVKCTDATSIVVSGTHATIFGNAQVNGVATTYRIDVDDLVESGRNRDTFRIRTASGYDVGGLLTNGNIQIHKGS